MLMALVYGLFLVLVGVTASAQAGLVSAHVSATMLNNVVVTDASLVRTFANGSLRLTDFDPGGPSADRLAAIQGALASSFVGGDIVRAEIRSPDGIVLASNLPGLDGVRAPTEGAFQGAARGTPDVRILAAGDATEVAGPDPLGVPDVIRE